MIDLLAQLKDVCRSGDGWTARCPAHADRHNSLSVHHSDGGWLLKCHGGCGWRRSSTHWGLRLLVFSAGCGWEARSCHDNKLVGLGKIWIDAADGITAEVTS